MRKPVELGFAWLLLDENQRATIKRVWLKYPRGRYLLPFEMGRILKIELKKTASDAEQENMWESWIDFCRQTNSDQDSIPFDHSEWFAWVDFVASNYQEPLELTTGSDWNER